MKYQKPSAEEIARRNEIRAIRQRHYERMAAGIVDDPVNEPDPAPSGAASASEVVRAVDDLIVAKGPRGKWYVKRGKEIVTGPFETKEAAAEVLSKEPA